ncbi:hypothetical protein AJ88_21590 [Mesorhizobium amorphae CCBAU 01583]|nr:hypothetical protein AJ88_21590 [Mesorhizobium amorphae CCBAU 01583]
MRITPFPDAVLRVDDILLIEGDHAALDRLVAHAKLSLEGSRKLADKTKAGVEAIAIEAVVSETSSLIGWSAQRLLLFDRFNVNLLAVPQGPTAGQRLGLIELKIGTSFCFRATNHRCLTFCASSGCCHWRSAHFCSAVPDGVLCRF